MHLQTTEICFGNAFHIKNPKTGYNIKSSGFNVSGIVQRVYLGDLPNSDQERISIPVQTRLRTTTSGC